MVSSLTILSTVLEQLHIRRSVARIVLCRHELSCNVGHPSSTERDDGGYTPAAVSAWITAELCLPGTHLTEPAVMGIADMTRATAGRVSAEMTLRQTSQSDGAAEREVQPMRGLAQTLELCDQTRLEFDD